MLPFEYRRVVPSARCEIQRSRVSVCQPAEVGPSAGCPIPWIPLGNPTTPKPGACGTRIDSCFCSTRTMTSSAGLNSPHPVQRTRLTEDDSYTDTITLRTRFDDIKQHRGTVVYHGAKVAVVPLEFNVDRQPGEPNRGFCFHEGPAISAFGCGAKRTAAPGRPADQAEVAVSQLLRLLKRPRVQEAATLPIVAERSVPGFDARKRMRASRNRQLAPARIHRLSTAP
jgi:hypothetical protein